MYNEEFGWPLWEAPGRCLDFWNDSVFVIHGGLLEPRVYANEAAHAGSLGSFRVGAF